MSKRKMRTPARSALTRRGARAGAAAFLLGLSLAAPAAAEEAETEPPGADPGPPAASARTGEPPAATGRASDGAREPGRRSARSAAPAGSADPADGTAPLPAAAARAAAAVTATVPADTRRSRISARESRAAESARAGRTAPGLAVAPSPAPTPVANPFANTVVADGPGTPPSSVVSSVTSAAVTESPRAALAEAAQPTAETVIPAAPAEAAPVAMATVGIPAGEAAATSVADLFTGLLAPIRTLVEGAGLLIRRALFNQAPEVNPVQTTGQVSGPITGTIGAVDPEGEAILYQITQAPQYGSVVIGPDGDFTYTPGTGFTGLDSFAVSADDLGFGINLLDLGRPATTEAYVQIAQNATLPMLTFSFVYGRGSQYWSGPARAALQASAMSLARYLVVSTPTTLTYDVTAERSAFSSTLASAGSDLTGYNAGFHPTVVQQKILTGVDANGSAADGEISWNFGQPWALGATVSNSQYDFTSTAMHELMHTLGFLSYTDRAGANTGRIWTVYDSFLVNAAGTEVIGADYRWQSAYNANLTGGNGGLFFGGPNAVAVYGGLVPLYTPSPWESGSSVSHLDDDTFFGVNTAMMNAYSDTGLGVRVLGPVELAILEDLGYQVSPSPLAALVLLGFGLVRRPRRNASAR